MIELAERVEKASGPNFALEQEIGAAVHAEMEYQHPGSQNPAYPAYTASLDAAMSLVPEGWAWQAGVGIETEVGNVDQAYAWCAPVNEGELVFAATPALALCAASLRARATPSGHPQ